MSENIDLKDFEEMLKGSAAKAEDYLKNPEGLEAALQKLETTMKNIPYVGKDASRLPLMISMIRSYITQEYTEVSPKVVTSMVGLVLYLLKKKDLIPDNIPLIGKLDDLAAIALVLKLNEPELKAYAKWRDSKPQRTAETEEKPAEETAAPEEPAAPETPAGPVSDEDVKEVAGGRIENGFVHDYCSLCGVDVEAPYEEGKITKLVCPACGHIMYRRYY
jgi:uncharacterized membrane protein YkvA (DUF1232 family)/predicted RNA-binding Zn-ribbon protein involved in translation (DUF1610 family)